MFHLFSFLTFLEFNVILKLRNGGVQWVSYQSILKLLEELWKEIE